MDVEVTWAGTIPERLALCVSLAQGYPRTDRRWGEIGSKTSCGERNMVREKGRRSERGCLKWAIRRDVLCAFTFAWFCRLIKSHQHPSLFNALASWHEGCSTAPTDEGIDVFSATGQNSQPSFLAEPLPCSCCTAGLGPWCLISSHQAGWDPFSSGEAKEDHGWS